ncbi:hypothetical protein DdX_19276 [Ditylenchus destructor]|uniref:RRM domain-containing protein n=1 Tax=Ditylenchus destructor TaxID=166010 RepID=A0AAD4QXA2_9BILA|nr:hypothetical protein DdX_19276 [Ditylenchus destructor]
MSYVASTSRTAHNMMCVPKVSLGGGTHGSHTCEAESHASISYLLAQHCHTHSSTNSLSGDASDFRFRDLACQMEDIHKEDIRRDMTQSKTNLWQYLASLHRMLRNRQTGFLESYPSMTTGPDHVFLPFTSMLNLRFAFQKCVPRASILGNSPICHQTPRSSNAIHISRLSYSDGNTQEAESTSQQMTHAEMNHSKKAEATKSPPAIANDPEVNSAPPAIEDETLKKVQKSMNLDFRRYHIFVRGYSRNISQKMLEKFYSQFGQVIQCVLYKNKQGVPEALVVFWTFQNLLKK